MDGARWFGTGLKLAGGLAVFLLGMSMMTGGLRELAETRVRRLLGRLIRFRFAGLGLGVALGFLAHSSGASALCVGLVHAGLMSLAEAVPPMLGAGVGTSLSMQLISFRLGDYSYLLIACGFLLRIMLPRERRDAGTALLGFGLLFLGMQTLSAAIEPHRNALTPLLAGVDGSRWPGLLAGIGAGLLVTLVVQSSGATIGIGFVLCRSGVLTELVQIYPLLLGAQVGTCITALLACIGTHINARRAALAHLVYRVLNAALAAAAAPLILGAARWTSDDLVRQAANANTLVMLAGAAVFLPLARPLAGLTRVVWPSRHAEPRTSFLDEALLDRPESAAAAAIRELQRTAYICLASFRSNAVLILRPDRRAAATVKLNEETVNRIKARMRDYLGSLAGRRLSRRQAILIQYLDRCMSHLERISDHIDALGDLSRQRHQQSAIRFDRPTLRQLFSLYREVERVLGLVIESLDAELKLFDDTAEDIVESRRAIREKVGTFNHYLIEKLALHELAPIAGIYLNRYVTLLNRIVRHADAIAAVELKPDFFIKASKLDRVVPREESRPLPPPEDPEAYLDSLHARGA
ncbi:MAG: Na/Pi cotransporter family protein [Phycisphaerae bacterium]|nr:Na/Pi cotransporter family protein [Phycisphaerae bacterium]